MKITALLFLVASPAFATYAIDGNPDKYMSAGINYYRHDLKGSFKESTQVSNFNITDGPQWKTNDIVFDLKIPVTSNLTCSLGGGYSKLDIIGRDTTIMNIGGSLFELNVPTTQEFSGYNLNVGARYYFK